MGKTVVVYDSKYGWTQRYARWIAQELGCEMFTRKQVNIQLIGEGDLLIYGGGLYAGGLSGLSFVKRYLRRYPQRRVVLFTCGLADPALAVNEKNIRTSLAKALPPSMQKQIRLFHFQGGIDYTRLSFVHRAMMEMMRRVLQKKDVSQRTEEDQAVLDTYGTRLDLTDQSSIQPLIQYVRRREPQV